MHVHQSAVPDLKVLSASSEALFIIPKDHFLGILFERASFSHSGTNAGFSIVRSVLGETVSFTYTSVTRTLTIRAPLSTPFPMPVTENWLGEPLRMLTGQLAYPRIAVRNYDDGRVAARISRSPPWRPDSDWIALFPKMESLPTAEAFIDAYCQLLVFTALGHDGGDSGLDSRVVTRLYEEIIQSCLGSRWVTFFTLAGSAENLARQLVPRNTYRADIDPKEVGSLKRHIRRWKGSEFLREAAARAVKNALKPSVLLAFREEVKRGTINAEHLSVWQAARNEVMHGELTSLYSSIEDDARLMTLMDLVHRLTIRVASEREQASPR